MRSFETDQAAKDFVREQIDVPALDTVEALGGGTVLHIFSQELDEATFTNVYDLSFPADRIKPSIDLHSDLTSVFDHVKNHSGIRATTGGGFFFLA